MKRALVTGGTGYVGRFIVNALLKDQWNVTVSGRYKPDPPVFNGSATFMPLALHPETDFAKATTGYDAIIHAAFAHEKGLYRGGEGTDIHGFWNHNYLASMQLFEAAATNKIPRLILLSSRAVYGPHVPGTLLKETTSCRPDTHYGLIKIALEQYLVSMAEKGRMCTSSLRATGVYGGTPGKWDELIRDYLAGNAIAPRVGTEIHGEDVGSAVVKLLNAPHQTISGQCYNLSDQLIDRQEILAPVRKRTGCTLPLPEQADASGFLQMSTAKLERLGWRAGGRDLFERSMDGTLEALLPAQSSSS